MKIAVKFALAAFLACIIPTASYVLFAHDAQSLISDRARSSFDETTQEFSQRLDDWYLTNQSALRTMARIPNLMSMDRAAGKAELKAFTNAMPWSRVVFASDATGMQVLRTDEEKPINISSRPYYQEAFEKGLGRLVAVSPVTGASSFYIVVPLAPETGGTGGLIGLGIDLDQVSRSIATVGKNDTLGRRVFIVDEEGKLLANSDPNAVAQSSQGALALGTKHPLWETRPRTGQMSISTYSDAAGKRWIGAIRQSSLGWYVAVEAPAEKFTAESERARATIWICALAASTFCALLGGLVGVFYARRPRTLARVARALNMGQTPQPGPPRDWGAYHDAARAVGLTHGMGSVRSGSKYLVLFCAFAVAVPALLGVSFFLLMERDRAEAAALRDARELLVASANRSGQRLLSWMDTNRVALTAISTMPGYADRMTSDKQEDNTWIKSRLKLAIVQFPWVRACFITDTAGTMLARSDANKLININDRLYFQQSRAGQVGQQIVISRVMVVKPTPVLNMSRPIKAADGTILGVTVFAIDVESASRQVAHEKIGRGGVKYVIDTDGGVLAYPDSVKMDPRAGKLPTFSNHPLWAVRPQGDVPGLLDYTLDGQRYLGAIAKTGQFYVAASIPRLEILEPVEPDGSDGVAWLLAAAAVALTLGGSLGLLVSQGVEGVADVARRVLRSESVDQETLDASDEHGDLSRALCALAHAGKVAALTPSPAQPGSTTDLA